VRSFHSTAARPPPPLLLCQLARSRLASRTVLAAVMEAAERALPLAKRSALLRRFKQSSMQLRRRERRQGGGAGGGGADDDEGAAPASFDALPADVLALVFRCGSLEGGRGGAAEPCGQS
jgi:hypothetical protein